jgi:hypothetical protein
MDETSRQLLRDTKEPLPMEPGSSRREDYEYERGGVANVFMNSPRRLWAGVGWT